MFVGSHRKTVRLGGVKMCNKTLHLADIKEFKDNIKHGTCPFCGKKLKWYDGSLGYGAYRCYICKFVINHFGMHFDDE